MTANRGAGVLTLAALKHPPQPFAYEIYVLVSSILQMKNALYFSLLGSAWVITCVHSQAVRRNENTRMSANGEDVA